MNGHFHGNPVLESLKGPRNYLMLQTPDHWFGYYTAGGELLVPRGGLHTDQGSIPRLLWLICSPDAFWSFYIHDGHYESHSRQVWTVDESGTLVAIVETLYVSREQADAWLLEGLRAEKCNWILARAIYRAVRLCGWVAWGRKTKKETV